MIPRPVSKTGQTTHKDLNESSGLMISSKPGELLSSGKNFKDQVIKNDIQSILTSEQELKSK